MKKLEIGGKYFEVHKSKYVGIESVRRYSGRTLNECYAQPSKIKQEIYNEWFMWAYKNEVHYFGVSSYNSMTFSLQGLAEVDGQLYVLAITKTTNKAYIV